ncbi:MAG: hypothetical protein WA957_16960, partial [Alteraurantiacibacter sp.]
RFPDSNAVIPVSRVCLATLAGLALAACSAEQEPAKGAPEASSTMMPVEPDGGIGDGAGPPDPLPAAQLEQTMPQTLRGSWRKDDLGRAPDSDDCDIYRPVNQSWERVITVREGGYSHFETGGRIMEVHNRTTTMIDATFDTTYADTPTSARKDFALQADGTLAVNDDNGDGRMEVSTYLRCPG